MGDWFSFVVILNQPPLKITIKFIMYHYVYYSYEEWGRGYIGVRSCKCLPEEDVKYFGSYTDKIFRPTGKIILLIFETREKANQAEMHLHAAFDVARNPHFANKANSNSSGFPIIGPLPKEHAEKIKLAKIRYWADEHLRQKHMEAMERWRQNNPEQFDQRTIALVKGGDRWRSENRNHLANTLKKATEAAKLKNLQDPEGSRKRSQNAVQERNKKLAENPEFDKLRLSKISRPVVLITPTGEEIQFESKLSCAQYLGISLTPIVNTLAGKPSRKLKGYTLRLLS